MRAQLPLKFTGRRWPAARVVARVDAFDVSQSDLAKDLKPVAVAQIATTGDGREWTTRTAMGFWKNFAELDMESDTAIAFFCRQHGDPHGALTPTTPIHTYRWLPIQTILGLFAEAWQAPDENGISRASPDAPTSIAGRFVAEHNGGYFSNVRVCVDREAGLAIETTNLAEFMIASATSQLFRKAPLHRCDNCGDWHEFARVTLKTCSAACRIALSRRNREQK